MADEEQNPKTEMVTSKDGVWKIDVDIFTPSPDGYVVVQGVSYPIYSFMDIPVSDSLRVARLSEDIQRAETYEDRMERSKDQVLLLNKPAFKAGQPVLSREHFDSLSPREIITLTVLASSIAQVPLKTETEKTESPNSGNSPSASPVSVASSDGGQEKSSV